MERVKILLGHVTSANNTNEDSSEVLHKVFPNGCGLITLNRPKKLNALTTDMVRSIRKLLQQWKNEGAIKFVAFSSMGERAFCAGGDIHALATQPGFAEVFFREEYHMNFEIATYPKPVVSLLKGIVMGGGVGISVHGTYRIVTEKTVFAMPETGIGLFPDVGGTHFLPNVCPGAVGMFLALTGTRLKGGDIVAAGIGTHLVPVASLAQLQHALTHQRQPAAACNLQDIISLFSASSKSNASESANPKPSATLPLQTQRPLIDKCFSLHTVPAIVRALQNCAKGEEEAEQRWAEGVLATLNKKSPTSVQLTFEALRRNGKIPLPAALNIEYRLGVRIVNRGKAGDFYEGVRATVIDKKSTPHWNLPPSTAEVEDYFAPFPKDFHVAELDL
mmetsp:Transcript_12194/g.23314  ORF Transcript_12194/g.23314 Transcript_12194/m.23314 type:complete len:390 (+) Transcript_12194:42-1211(+)